MTNTTMHLLWKVSYTVEQDRYAIKFRARLWSIPLYIYCVGFVLWHYLFGRRAAP
jgi:hypothetical protein